MSFAQPFLVVVKLVVEEGSDEDDEAEAPPLTMILPWGGRKWQWCQRWVAKGGGSGTAKRTKGAYQQRERVVD